MSALPDAQALDAIARLKAAICAVVHGKDDVVELALTGILAGGHLLLEDVPGVGKTTLAASLASALGGSFSRIQFTADLLPGDITGMSIYENGEFAFRSGPLFANVVLADEINRTSPKTQSALFEAMEERRVTVDGRTRPLPSPFVVVATQNPYDVHGTFPLPDSQLDRFLMRIAMGYPDREAERAVLRRGGLKREAAATVATPEEVNGLVEAAGEVRVPDAVEDYLLDLVRVTREDQRLLRGVSTRGAQALYRAVRARALVQGRTFAIPEDIRALAVPVLAHRVLARIDGGPSGLGGARAIREILGSLPPPA
ncbi:MAG: MoxR family ATPase [Deltaproteobacteria bacterium]|nr:MAG: MoxR family ATPase [Deltaproteobacteria bacterium]